MKLVRSRIKYQGLEISVKDAKEIAIDVDCPDAYEKFRKAKKMKSWNLVWSFIGGWEVGRGVVNVVEGNPIGAIDVLLGAGLIALPYSRNRKRKYSLYLKAGINAYNESLEK